MSTPPGNVPERGFDRWAERRAAAKAKQLEGARKRMYLPESKIVESIRESAVNMPYLCGVHRPLWKQEAGGSRCYLASLPCDGGKAGQFECCFSCSKFFYDHKKQLADWFGLAVQADMRCARYFVEPESSFIGAWNIPFDGVTRKKF